MYSTILSLSLFVALCRAITPPWVAEARTDDFWVQRHHLLLNQTKEHMVDLKVIFIGDSITQGWEGYGKDIWNEYYLPRHAYNYGINGDRTQNVIYRMENGEFDGLNAKVVVIKIGTNNIYGSSEADIAKGIRECVDQILHRQTHARVLLLGIIPRDGQTEVQVQNVNHAISQFNDDKRVFYLDMSPHFQTAPGVEIMDLYVDKVHLTTKGFQVWHDVMEPLFSKLYNMTENENI